MPRPRNPEPGVRKTLTLPAETWEAVNKFRYQAEIPSLTEAVKRLIEAGLEARLARTWTREEAANGKRHA